MGLAVCPAVVVAAPVERVWALLADPARYDRWWDARTSRIVPEGPARPGQTLHARSAALGKEWDVTTVIEHVDESRHQIRLRTRLPFGIVVQNNIACVPLDGATCRVQFG
jgi:Polyketide cyclase / dehydrase and lipid transport